MKFGINAELFEYLKYPTFACDYKIYPTKSIFFGIPIKSMFHLSLNNLLNYCQNDFNKS